MHLKGETTLRWETTPRPLAARVPFKKILLGEGAIRESRPANREKNVRGRGGVDRLRKVKSWRRKKTVSCGGYHEDSPSSPKLSGTLTSTRKGVVPEPWKKTF